jgi:hypothetical protein
MPRCHMSSTGTQAVDSVDFRQSLMAKSNLHPNGIVRSRTQTMEFSLLLQNYGHSSFMKIPNMDKVKVERIKELKILLRTCQIEDRR